jgi:hypothetical protein
MVNSTAFQNALTVIDQLSSDEQRELLHTLRERLDEKQDDWALEGEQLAFMVQHKDEIEAAYADDNMNMLTDLASSKEYQTLFGDMPWDEAYDRFEETWWIEGD